MGTLLVWSRRLRGCCKRMSQSLYAPWTAQLHTAIQLAQNFLIQSRLPDAGWGYYAGIPQAYPEPTCYSLLALSDTAFSPTTPLDWLASLVNPAGQLYLPNDDSPNWATSLLVIALSRLNQLPAVQQASVNWLLAWKSNYIDTSYMGGLNGSLIGWSWISDTFSWVEPTSYAVLALKLAGQGRHERVKEAETLLFDRMCQPGGWNFGNPLVLGRPIEPSLPETAIALFALQDLPEAAGAIEKGLALLEQDTPRFPSALSLALTILCLDVFDRPTDRYVELLLARQEADGSWRQGVWWTALAVLALKAAAGDENVFQL